MALDHPPSPSESGPSSGVVEESSLRSLRVAAILVALATIPAVVLGSAMIQRGRSSLRLQAVERFRSESENRVRAIDDFLEAVRLDLLFLTQVQTLRNLASIPDDDPVTPTAHEKARSDAETELLAFSEGRRAFYQVRYIDEQGREVVRLNVSDGRPNATPKADLQDKQRRYYVQEALQLPLGAIYVSRLDANIENGKVETPLRMVVRFAAKVPDRDGIARGILVLNINADHILSLLGSLPDDTQAWLLNRDDDVLGVVGARGPSQPSTSLDAPPDSMPPPPLHDTDDVLLYSRPTSPGLGTDGWKIVVARAVDSIDAPVRAMTTYLQLLGLIVVLLAGSAGIVVARGLTRATRRLEEARAELRSVNASLEAEVERRTEELQAMERGLMRVDKLASIGQLTAGLLHEVGNPLAAIKTKIQVEEEDGLQPHLIRPLLNDVVAEVNRLSTFLRSFARFSRLPPANPQPVDAATLVRSVVSLIAPEFKRRGCVVDVAEGAGVPPILADADQLRQVILNLMLNASLAEPKSGSINVRVDHRTTASGSPGVVAVEVEDDGCGIPEEHLARLFDPFFTTRSEGSGLGLPICERIVREYGGTIEIVSRVGEGTRVIVKFPVDQSSTPS